MFWKAWMEFWKPMEVPHKCGTENHHFEPRYNYGGTKSAHTEGMGIEDIERFAAAFQKRNYIHDICIHCGEIIKIKERKSERLKRIDEAMIPEDLINKIKTLVSDICMFTGLNLAHDYDGVETNEDIILYLKAILKKIRNK